MRQGNSDFWRLKGLLLASCLGFASLPLHAAPETPPATQTAEQQAAARYAGKSFTILDASEVQLDGASAMVVTFSIPLAANQNFASLLNLVDEASGKVDGAWEMSDNMMELRLRHLEPSRKLILTINKNLSGVNGIKLDKEFQQKLTTRDIEPSIGFASRGSLLPSKVITGLPVIALNVNKVDVNFYRIKPEMLSGFLANWEGTGSKSYWESQEFLNKVDLAYTGRFDLNPQRNTREQVLLPLNSIKELQQPGVYLAMMQEAGVYQYSNPVTIFTLSDIGISLHRYHDRLDVFTQALEGGEGVSGVKVELFDEKGNSLAQAKTSSDGHAQLIKDDKAKIMLATKDGQTSLIDLSKSALDLSEFDIAGPEGFATQFFAFGPRDLYRPGETLIVNGLLRDSDGAELPDQPVKVDVLKPDNQVTRSFVWQPKKNGFYQFMYDIPNNAATGEWSLRINLGDKQPRFYKFKVEDFLPERMALELKSVEDVPVSPSQEITFDVTGRYLYGAPASGNRLQGQMFLRPARDAVAKLPGYEFGSVLDTNLSRSLNEFDLKLDSEGLTSVTVPSGWAESKSPMKVIIQASLMESGGRPVTRRAEQAIWPATNMPGIRPLFNKKEVYDYKTNNYKPQFMVDSDSLAGFDIVYANAKGNKLSADGLNVRLVRERRDYYWEWSSSDGWSSRYDQKDLIINQENISIGADQVAKVSYPVEWGSYRLEVEDPHSGMVTSLRFWAGYSWQDNTDGTGALRPDQVKLKLDKPAYRTGEKVNLHVEAPTAGKGYLMLESSDGPLWWQEIEVPVGGANFNVPINEEWNRHDLYLSALVVRPGDKNLQSTPKRAVGLLHLPLVDENRKITLALDAPERMRPNQTLTVKVKASVKNGELPKSINVLMSAVDSGVLNITNYVTPDPYEAFFGRKRYSVDQMDIYGQLIEGKGKTAKLSFGGDGEDDALARGGKKPVTVVKIVAQQAMPVVLNDKGEGEIQMPIPDFNGELRLMAQAWSDEEFGSAERKMIVAAPLIAELSMPRFIAGGDRSILALDLSNLTDGEQSLNVTVETKGLVKQTGAAQQTIKLTKGQRKTLSIPIEALNGFGQGDVTVRVNGLVLPGEASTAFERHWTLGVRPATPAKTNSYAMTLRAGESWALPQDALLGLSTPTVEGQMSLTAVPPLNVAQHIRELFAYPYGCLEQTTSGLYPSLYTNQAQLAALGIKSDSDDVRRRNIDVGIERLLGMQKDNGSFSLWEREGSEEYWLTAYVTDFLVRAREQGYSVREDALNKANQRLLRYLQDRNQIEPQYISNASATNAAKFSVQAYAGLVLARQQQAPLGALRQLYERRGEAMSGLPQVQLGVALQLMGDMPKANQLIQQGVAMGGANRNTWLGDYGSDLRDNALILSLLNEYHLLPQQQDSALMSLSDALVSNRYLSTQERNAVYLAGRDLPKRESTEWEVEVSGVESKDYEETKSVSALYDATQLAKGINLTNSGSVTVYPRIDITGYPLKQPAPVSNRLHIERNFLNLDGSTASLDHVSSGQLLVVHLNLWADNQVNDALVVDLLPAGFELENQNLGSSSASLSESAGELMALQTKMQSAEIKYQEYRDDRYVAAVKVDGSKSHPVTLLYLVRAVTPGTYSVPAPQVESMYKPEWHAIGATPARLEIK
ncbi:MAG: alpha-2-macroglobulin family protein [Limnobaculum xujianqingii]